MSLFSPLEQFAILKIINIKLGFFDFSFTNSSLLALISVSIAILVYTFAFYEAKLIPSF
jgi:hypothetical protein